jgi:hypothetical protein
LFWNNFDGLILTYSHILVMISQFVCTLCRLHDTINSKSMLRFFLRHLWRSDEVSCQGYFLSHQVCVWHKPMIAFNVLLTNAINVLLQKCYTIKFETYKVYKSNLIVVLNEEVECKKNLSYVAKWIRFLRLQISGKFWKMWDSPGAMETNK